MVNCFVMKPDSLLMLSISVFSKHPFGFNAGSIMSPVSFDQMEIIKNVC